jgi:hypothetical protein
MKRFTAAFLTTVLLGCMPARAGVQIQNSSSKVLGAAAIVGCGSGLTCTMSGAKVTVAAPGTNGAPLLSGSQSTYIPWPVTATTGIGTSTSGSATTVFLTQVFIDNNATLTGIAVNNGATVGTNKYIVALFNSSGTPLANSALAGTNTAGASAWQKIAFTSTVAVVGPATYYVGVYMNGATDNFFTIPAAGEYVGTAGTNTGQTFGTVAAVTVPTTFTAGQGPIVHTY